MLRADPPPVAGREVLDISAVIHAPTLRPSPAMNQVLPVHGSPVPPAHSHGAFSHARVAPLELGGQDPPAAYGVCK